MQRHKDASKGISVMTKMLHIDFTKRHQKAFEGGGGPWKATITLETLREACETGLHPRMVTSPCSPRQRPIVIGCCFPQPMPPQKSYTPPHKNLIFLISFPHWATVCNISQKLCVRFEHGGDDRIASSARPPSPGSRWHPGPLHVKASKCNTG